MYKQGDTFDGFVPRTTNGQAVRAFLGVFQELYAAHRNGAKYFVRRPKDPVLIGKLLEVYGAERLEQMAEELLTLRGDKWLDSTDCGIGILTVMASKLDSRLAMRPTQAPRAVDWFEECAQVHQGACGLDRWGHQTRMEMEAQRT